MTIDWFTFYEYLTTMAFTLATAFALSSQPIWLVIPMMILNGIAGCLMFNNVVKRKPKATDLTDEILTINERRAAAGMSHIGDDV